MLTSKQNPRITFGLYEVDLKAGELWRGGYRIKLQSQPFKVLSVLLERPGEVVTRDELQQRLWGNDTIVDFDHSLATAINKIREALRDSADNPRFVETLARRGYRFIAPLTRVEVPEAALPQIDRATIAPDSVAPAIGPETDAFPASASAAPASTSEVGVNHPVRLQTIRQRTRVRGDLVAFLVCAALIAALGAGYLLGSEKSTPQPLHIAQLTHSGHLAAGVPASEAFTASVTDGFRLFVPILEGGQQGIATLSTSGGALVPLAIPDEVASPVLGDISPDGARLLLRNHLSPESEQPLWIVPVSGGSALRVGAVLAHDATWMPDGNGILFAAGNDLYVAPIGGGSPQHYASLAGRAFWLRWNPAGKLLRFTVVDPIAHTESLWQLTASDRLPHPLLSGFTTPSTECCGVWTGDGSSFVFQSTQEGNADLWRLAGNSTRKPIRLTDGPLQFQSPVAARSGNEIYFLGVDLRSQLARVTPAGELVPERGFLASADRVEFSHRRKWVAWTDGNGRLWRAASDGSQKLQLTPDTLGVFLARWSPDDSRIAFMAREPGKAWKLYLVPASGGDLQPLLQETRNAADPSWSPDGQSLVFGRINDTFGKENASRTLQVVNLRTDRVEELPGSEGLFSPRWSPDGRWIAALTLDQRQVRLFDVTTRTWSTLSIHSGADPVWSSDSRSLYVHESLDPAQPIDRIAVPGGSVTELIRLSGSSESNAVDYVFVGLNGEDQPLVRARTSTGNLYSLRIK